MTVAAAGAPVHWHMPAEMRAQLLGPAGLPLADWRRAGIATVVKEAPHRAVYRVQLPGLDVHVKQYRLLGWRSRIRQMLRPVKARREYEIAAELRARDITTPDPVAWGTEGLGFGPAPSWLITATVPDSMPLLNYVETTLPQLSSSVGVQVRQRLARAIGLFLARLHVAGVVHHDLHPGNLLVRISPNGEPLLWLIDLHAVTLGPPCPWETRRSNLTVFNRYFQMRASRADRFRFWQSYCAAAAGAVPGPARLAACQLEQRTEQSNLQFWQARDARCLRSNRYYKRLNTGPVRGFAVRDLDPEALTAFAADPDSPFNLTGARILKDSRSSTVVEFDLLASGERRRVIYKRFRLTDRRDPWLGLVRKTPAIRSWMFGQGLLERCLPTARPLAVFHRVLGGLPREGYLLTQKIENAVDLHEFMRRLAGLPDGVRTPELRKRIVALARLLRHLHQRGLTHRDLKASNLLAAETIGDVRFWFIDLVGVRRPRRVGGQRKMRDLMRLHVSFLSSPLVTRTTRLRFLRAYLQVGLTGAGGWKDRWRSIDAATRIKVAKNAASGRVLA